MKLKKSLNFSRFQKHFARPEKNKRPNFKTVEDMLGKWQDDTTHVNQNGGGVGKIYSHSPMVDSFHPYQFRIQGASSACAPMIQHVLNSMQFFFENCKIVCWRSLWRFGAPSYEEFRIRPCLRNFLDTHLENVTKWQPWVNLELNFIHHDCITGRARLIRTWLIRSST